MSSDLATIIKDIGSQLTGDGVISICIARGQYWVEVDGRTVIITGMGNELDEAVRIANGIKYNEESIDYE